MCRIITDERSFANERLARHYGIKGVYGVRFRKVELTDPNRFGLFGHGSILSLTAPSPAALSGVLLGGRGIAPEGTWVPPKRLPRAANKRGTISVRIAPSSAALVTVSPKAS